MSHPVGQKARAACGRDGARREIEPSTHPGR